MYSLTERSTPLVLVGTGVIGGNEEEEEGRGGDVGRGEVGGREAVGGVEDIVDEDEVSTTFCIQ